MSDEQQQKDVNELMAMAQEQLDDHKVWLADRIRAMPADVSTIAARELLATQAGQIRVRLASVRNGRASIVYDYPDELHAFLRSGSAPKELRDTLAEGHDIDPSQPASSFKRVTE